MAGRRTNLALLFLLTGAFVTGIFAYALGTARGAAIVVAHGIIGLTIVALAPWKSIIVRRGLRKTRGGTASSIGLIVLVVVSLVAGVLHSTGALISLGPVSAMQVHVGAALLAIPLGVAHVRARPVKPRVTDASRRAVLRAGALVGGTGVAYLAIEGLARVLSLPGAERRFTGSHELGSFDPAAMPVTQWFNDTVPTIDTSSYRLEVRSSRGLSTYAIEELDAGDHLPARIDCTGGWWAEQDWSGIMLRRLVEGLPGRSVVVRSETGYARAFPLSSDLMLATRVGGRPLSAGHGAPLRLVAPGRRGFWWVKWVTRIEVGDRPWWLQSPFPLT